VLPAPGTFYAWCDVSEAIHMRGLADDNAFAEFLLEKAGVAGVPGSGFGAPGHIRFSFAVSMQTLETGPGPHGQGAGRGLITFPMCGSGQLPGRVRVGKSAFLD